MFITQFNYVKKHELMTLKVDEKIQKRKKFNFNKTKLLYEVVDDEPFKLGEFIQSFKASCNLKMLIDKFDRVQDFEATFGCKPGFYDENNKTILTDEHLPVSVADAYQKMQNVDKAFANIPKELRGDKSVADFINSFSVNQLDEYIKNTVAKLTAKKDKEVK